MALIQKLDSSDLYTMACSLDRGENFGYNGWRAIGDYLEQLSIDTGEDLEVDIIAICCDYNCVNSIEEFLQEFPGFIADIGEDETDFSEWDEQEKYNAISEYLSDNAACVACEDGLIIWQAF